MSDLRDVTDELLADRPAIEDDLRAILAVDERKESWTFDDVPVDSGTFGELVARDIVAAVGDEYHVADRDEIKAALENEPRTADRPSSEGGLTLSSLFSRIDPVLTGTLVGLLAFVVVLRTAVFWPAVFRGSDTVLLGNDPYYYRYWLEELFRTGASITSPPPVLQDTEIAMFAVLHGVASLLGGGQDAVSFVLAWYPVVTSVLIGCLVYVIALVAVADRRVALASVAVYAVTPTVAYRTALGFGDHHAFDYFLVALAVAGLLLLVDERADWRTITPARGVGFSLFSLAIATQVHAWRGGLLMILPVAAYIVSRVASDVRAGELPLQANAWTLGALTAAAGLALIPHLAYGWSGVYRAFAPALLLAGSLVVVGIGELAARHEIAASTVLGINAIGGLVLGTLAWVTFPGVQRVTQAGVGFFIQTSQTSITETRSLLSPEAGVIMSPLFYLGFTFPLAVATLVWATWRVQREHQPTWLALTTYTGGFFMLALIQLRFAGQFGILAAVFAGLGFVYLVAAVDATGRPRPFTETESQTGPGRACSESVDVAPLSIPDRQSAFAVAVLFLLVGGFGAAQMADSDNSLLIEDATYDAAKAIDAHSRAADRTWPDNYVFSDWDRNRVYNYYVNNQSRSYSYAQQHYDAFLVSSDPSAWYDRLSAKPTGYVVVSDVDGDPPPMSMQSRLWNNWGSHRNGVAGVSHYRMVYASDERKVFELVPGARLVGTASPNSEVTVTTTQSVSGVEFTYSRAVETSGTGAYAVTVPYAGNYTVAGTPVQVSETAVQQNQTVSVSASEQRLIDV